MAAFVHNDLCVGIDLGTTNSALATINVVNGRVNSPVRNIQRFSEFNALTGRPTRSTGPLLPSCIYYKQDRDGSYAPIVGDFAKRQHALKPWLVSRSIKSQMGNEKVSGLQEDIPDKTPEAVAAQILKHLLADAEEHFMCKLNDAVITVPASFNPAMREATLRAAEIAGIHVRNDDGSFNDDMLLSEPEAVMYDMINQIQSGTFDANIDFSAKKRILVFDIGGGTLDITIHDVERDKTDPEILNITPIAINRYTKIGGDDFDDLVAEDMYSRYIEMYSRAPEIVEKIKKDSTVKPNLLAFAEELKLQISDQYYELKQRGIALSDDKMYDCGGLLGNGYSYDDSYTKADYESIVAPLMGIGLQYHDYKRADSLTETSNIVYPVLNVLKKAADSLNEDDIKIDAVVLNGGMSKLYLIQNRIEELFGFKPLIVTDPDKSVAMGAAVYHYYLHKKTSLVKKMRGEYAASLGSTITQAAAEEHVPEKEYVSHGIVTSQSILNDDIYLGLRGGAVHKLCKAGELLPFESEVMTGFAIDAGQDMLSIPIREKTNGETYRTIASGRIRFDKSYNERTPVSIKFGISKSQIITLKAWTSTDESGVDVIESGQIVLNLGAEEGGRAVMKLVPQNGTKLIPANEMKNLENLHTLLPNGKYNASKGSAYQKTKEIRAKIKTSCTAIKNCGNPQDFVDPLIEYLSRSNNEQLKQRILYLMRRMAPFWTQEQVNRCCAAAYQLISPELSGFRRTGEAVATVDYAIRLLGHSDKAAYQDKLMYFVHNNRHIDACVYAFARSKKHVDWMHRFLVDSFKARHSLCNAVWGISIAAAHNAPIQEPANDKVLLNDLCRMIESGSLNRNDIVDAVIAIGTICDQRASSVNPVPKDLAVLAEPLLERIPALYSDHEEPEQILRAIRVTRMLCSGTELNAADEAYLLSRFDEDEN